MHGLDAVPPVPPERAALAVTVQALLAALELRDPALIPVARALDPVLWVEAATGRLPAPPELAAVLPLPS